MVRWAAIKAARSRKAVYFPLLIICKMDCRERYAFMEEVGRIQQST
ncbi:hypothetical protein ACEQPO_08235 [Bacillus sp. SL00103]